MHLLYEYNNMTNDRRKFYIYTYINIILYICIHNPNRRDIFMMFRVFVL